MATKRYQLEVGNVNVGATNTAIWDLHVVETPSIISDDIVVGQMIAMTVYMFVAAGTYIAGARVEEVGAAGSVPVPFPTATWDDLVAGNPGELPALTGYGQEMGSGAISALGTGLTISEYTAIPGRHTTGRIYTPYLRQAALATATGLVLGTTIADTEEGYGLYILGSDPSNNAIDLQAVVYSPTTLASTPITVPKVSVRPCRLKTRTR